MERPRLFVYGTLRKGSPNPFARLLEANARFLGNGRMRGRLYQFANYPGAARTDEPDRWVAGELYELTDPGILTTLDGYEGQEFERVVVTVHLEAEEAVEAWVYLLRRAPGK